MPEFGSLPPEVTPSETRDQEPGEGKAESQEKQQQLPPGAWLWVTLHSPAPGSSVLPHIPATGHSGRKGAPEAGDQGRVTSGRASNSKLAIK